MSNPTGQPRLPERRPGSRAGILMALSLALFVAPGVSGCGAQSMTTARWTAGPAAAVPVGPMDPGAPEAMQAAWAARPAYVRADARTQEAYAFALAAPQVLKWMPCYCGCDAMGHRSNADCFFKPTREGLSNLAFEEHASYCQVCVDTALMAKRMLGEGQSLRAIRNAVDATFGGSAPGTPTELPPA
jgi:hypothetical protein